MGAKLGRQPVHWRLNTSTGASNRQLATGPPARPLGPQPVHLAVHLFVLYAVPNTDIQWTTTNFNQQRTVILFRPFIKSQFHFCT